MIKKREILFGYGTIAAHGNVVSKTLSFKSIQPPKEVGIEIKDHCGVLEEVLFKYGEDMKLLYGQVKSLTKENNQIEFRGYILDFSNFNEKSVAVVRKAISNVIYGWQMCLAA